MQNLPLRGYQQQLCMLTFLLGRQPSPPKGFSNSNTAISVQSQLHKQDHI